MSLHFTVIGFLSHVRTLINTFRSRLVTPDLPYTESSTADQAAADRWDSRKKEAESP